MPMRMSKFVKKFYKPEEVKARIEARQPPITGLIADVQENKKYDRPDLYMDNGGVVSLNTESLANLIEAWSENSDYWIGKKFELTLGHYKFQKHNDNGGWEDCVGDMIIVKPVSPPLSEQEKAKAAEELRIAEQNAKKDAAAYWDSVSRDRDAFDRDDNDPMS